MHKVNKKNEVNIYLEFLNYQNEVTESFLIATACNMSWAKLIVDNYKKPDDYTRLKMEEVK